MSARSLQMEILRTLQDGHCHQVIEISEATGIGRKDVVRAAGRLVSRGFLDRAEVGCFKLTSVGREFLASGKPITCGRHGPLTQSFVKWRKTTYRDLLWRAMRVLRTFTVPDLIELCGETKSAQIQAQRYTKALSRAGILRPMRQRDFSGQAPTSNGLKRWQLLRDLGELTPILRKDGIFDPNSGQLLTQEGDL